MVKKTTKAFSAILTIGLEKGYKKELIHKKEIICFLQIQQEKLIKEKGVYLSASTSACDIVLSGQVEPHLKLGFINYPKFPLPHKVLKYEIEILAIALMKAFEQNRVVIEYLDETVMFENTEDIDPRIKNRNKLFN